MKHAWFVVLCLSTCISHVLAQNIASADDTINGAPVAPASSSSGPAGVPAMMRSSYSVTIRPPRPLLEAPHSTFALTASTLGVGVEIATPLGRYLGVRGGFHMLPLQANFNANGIPYVAKLDEKSIAAQVDIAPFGGGFRVSPGLLLYNGVRASARATIAAGQGFDLGDATYTSSTTDPVIASSNLHFGSNFAPMVTMGWRNLLRTSRFTIPLEIGAVFTGAPKFSLNLTGTACDKQNQCGNLATDVDAQKNLAVERAKWKDNLSRIPVLPIISIGFAYRFGGMSIPSR